VSKFESAGMKVIRHAASSASSLLMKSSHFELVRLGISLYGVWPSQLTKVSYLQLNAKVAALKPVLSWKTEITTLKKVHAGQYIGYGCTFRANREMDIAVLPVGYNEGYPRLAGEGSAYVLIRGERCPIVGRICMNMMMVDVTHTSANLKLGDEVVLIGRCAEETISASDLGNWSKTIHYEIFTKLHPDIPRIVV
jgi:alanine racemase